MVNRKQPADQSGSFDPFKSAIAALAIFLSGGAVGMLVPGAAESSRVAIEPMVGQADATPTSIAQPQTASSSAVARGIEYFPAGYELKAGPIEPPIAQF